MLAGNDATEGTVFVGENDPSYNLVSLRDAASVVLQKMCSAVPVRDNLALGDPNATDEELSRTPIAC